MRPDPSIRPSVLGAAAVIVLLLLPEAASAEKRVKIDENVIPRAQIWIDGIPIFPPYELQIVGDTAFVINGRTSWGPSEGLPSGVHHGASHPSAAVGVHPSRMRHRRYG